MPLFYTKGEKTFNLDWKRKYNENITNCFIN